MLNRLCFAAFGDFRVCDRLVGNAANATIEPIWYNLVISILFNSHFKTLMIVKVP